MTPLGLLLALLVFICCAYPCASQDAPPTQSIAPTLWKDAAQPPFFFKYGGKESPQFLATWQHTVEKLPSEGGESQRHVYNDPATKLKITVDVRTFNAFPAVDWVLEFQNGGDKDTPIIEDVLPLKCNFQAEGDARIHHAVGSASVPDDFRPEVSWFNPGDNVELRSSGGRSSNGRSPFFNVQIGDHGVIGAIGWTGNWLVRFNCNRETRVRTMEAGMHRTHFVLHPGETVRTPRIVLLDWRGTLDDGQNQWRRLVLADYSPRDPKGQTVVAPLCFGSWGAEPIDSKKKMIEALQEKGVPYEVYWVDADWYGTKVPKEAAEADAGSHWWRNRGTWVPNVKYFPDGLKPLGEALKKHDKGFLLWIEPEQADPGTELRVEHPDWFFLPPNTNNPGTALLNLGNPEAWKGITDLVSKIITDGGVTWYRQDFNVEPDRSWASADKPDRVGISEMKHIAGLYAFWDELRKRHPGLQIDNCSSGGRRIDLETLSRSVPLFRSDLACNFFDPISGQMQTQGLSPWAPMHAAVYGGVAPGTPNEGASLIYAIRSSYSSGWLFGTDRLSIDVMKPAALEYKRVRPYFYGDFYPLLTYSPLPDFWAAWQLDRPDLKSGVVILLRRQNSPLSAMRLPLHGIQTDAQYQVEVRSGLEPVAAKRMSGRELSELQVEVAEKPGSALVFYTHEK